MAKHDVTFTIPKRPLGKADIEFGVKKDEEAFGRLKVSNGTIVWVQGNKTYGYRMNWTDFDKLMQDHGKKEKK